MSKNDNPAGRLFVILSNLKGQPTETPLFTAWAKALGIEPEVPKIFTALARLHDSLTEIERSIRQQDVDHDIYLRYFPQIREVLSVPNLALSVNSANVRMSESVLTSLEFCSERLSKFAFERGQPRMNWARCSMRSTNCLRR